MEEEIIKSIRNIKDIPETLLLSDFLWVITFLGLELEVVDSEGLKLPIIENGDLDSDS